MKQIVFNKIHIIRDYNLLILIIKLQINIL
jgi:hypothetical protein